MKSKYKVGDEVSFLYNPIYANFTYGKIVKKVEDFKKKLLDFEFDFIRDFRIDRESKNYKYTTDNFASLISEDCIICFKDEAIKYEKIISNERNKFYSSIYKKKEDLQYFFDDETFTGLNAKKIDNFRYESIALFLTIIREVIEENRGKSKKLSEIEFETKIFLKELECKKAKLNIFLAQHKYYSKDFQKKSKEIINLGLCKKILLDCNSEFEIGLELRNWLEYYSEEKDKRKEIVLKKEILAQLSKKQLNNLKNFDNDMKNILKKYYYFFKLSITTTTEVNND
jgi:hypothetical protein